MFRGDKVQVVNNVYGEVELRGSSAASGGVWLDIIERHDDGANKEATIHLNHEGVARLISVFMQLLNNDFRGIPDPDRTSVDLPLDYAVASRLLQKLPKNKEALGGLLRAIGESLIFGEPESDSWEEVLSRIADTEGE